MFHFQDFHLAFHSAYSLQSMGTKQPAIDGDETACNRWGRQGCGRDRCNMVIVQNYAALQQLSCCKILHRHETLSTEKRVRHTVHIAVHAIFHLRVCVDPQSAVLARSGRTGNVLDTPQT